MAPSASKVSKYHEDVALLKEHALRLREHHKPNIRSWANKHNLPYYRLRRAYLGLPTRSDKKPTNCRLSDEQDLALERYLDAIDAIGYGIHRGLITQQAYAMLQESYNGTEVAPPPLGKSWATRWLRRHPQYRRTKAKPMEIQRKLAQEPEALRGWFTKLEDCMKERGIHPGDMYNMDETGCRIGVASSQYVYTKNKQQTFINNANNRELITLVEAVSSDGAVIPPMVIVKATTVMEHWVVDIPNDYLIAVSESGYSNDTLALDWLKHFKKMTQNRRRGSWLLLLVDGHGSYGTKEFIEFAEQNKIQLFALPPHTTHFLQPLDVGCFQPLKWYHGRCLDWAARTGSKDISKADFLSTLGEIRRLTFTRNTICSGWRRCGLAPFKPDVVLGQLKRQEDCSEDERSPTPPLIAVRTTTPEVLSSPPLVGSSPTRVPALAQVRSFGHVKIDLQNATLTRRAHYTPELEEPRPGDTAWHTPKTVRQLHAQEPFVHAVIREHLPREVAASVIKHQRGVSALARTAEGLKRELRQTEAAQMAKDERRRRKRRALVVKGGPVYSQDARFMVQQRRVDDDVRLEAELAARKLRKVTTVANRHKKLLSTIRNWGGKYCRRAASQLTAMRNVARWVHAKDDEVYNSMAMRCLERMQEHCYGRVTQETTPACEVAGEARRLVDPYTKFITEKQHQHTLAEAQNNSRSNSTQELQTRSQSIKIESQELPVSVVEEMVDVSSDDDDGSIASLTLSDALQNDWGLQ